MLLTAYFLSGFPRWGQRGLLGDLMWLVRWSKPEAETEEHRAVFMVAGQTMASSDLENSSQLYLQWLKEPREASVKCLHRLHIQDHQDWRKAMHRAPSASHLLTSIVYDCLLALKGYTVMKYKGRQEERTWENLEWSTSRSAGVTCGLITELTQFLMVRSVPFSRPS